MSESVAEALPKEIRRVREEVLPRYQEIGQPGVFAATMMEASLQAADKAVAEQDVVLMVQALEDLRGYTT